VSTAQASRVTLGGRALALSNLGKVLYPEAGFTKGQVIDYYLRVSPVMLPHLKRRPVSLKRYPNGVDGKFFFQKNAPTGAPAWVKTFPVYSQAKGEDTNFVVVNNQATLIWLANLAALELHTYLSRTPNFLAATMMVFDMDPGPPAGLAEAMTIALIFRDFLGELGLTSFPKTSGGKGVHVYVPLNTAVGFDRTKRFAHQAALVMEKKYPGRVVSLMRKELRAGKVFVDWSQNDEHKTTACAYTLRARARPTVSTPVTWEEIESALRRKRPESVVFEAPQVLERVAELGDLFAPVLTMKQKLPKV